METPSPTSGEKAWYEKIDPDMTQDLLNEMAQEFASVYMSCREWLALTRFVAKGIVRPTTPTSNMSRSPAEEKEVLPPPPPPPTFHKKVDLWEYKERSKSHAPGVDRPLSERVPPRRSFIPDTSQVRPDLSMPHLALPGEEPIRTPLVSPHDNGYKIRDEHSRKEEERRREKERRRREEKERLGSGHLEDREKRKEDERRKREHGRISVIGHSGSSQPPLEKRPRHDLPLSSSSLSLVSPGIGSSYSSRSFRTLSQSNSVVHSSSYTHSMVANGSLSRRDSNFVKNLSLHCRPSESRTLTPPPPPPPITELEDGELE